jgi:lipopolysaccharide transport system permease protein
MSQHLQQEWTETIRPRTRLFDLKLGDIWRYRDLLVLFVKRDFAAQYKQTILGPLWHFIQPVFTTFIFLMLFSNIANIPTDGIEPVLFYMSGITIWNYFSACLNQTSSTFISNAGIFGKVYFPRLIIPLSVVLSNIVKLGIQFLLLIGAIIFYGVKGMPIHFGVSWLLIPVVIIIMAGIGFGLGIIISSLTTKYRDMNVLIGFGIQLLMYATPIAYPLSFLENKSYKWLLAYNPLAPVVEAFRYALFQQGTVSVFSLGYSVAFMVITVFLGLLIFNKVERVFMDTV